MKVSKWSELGRSTVGVHKITIIDESVTLIPAYRKSFKERDIIKKEFDDLEAADIISNSISPNSAQNYKDLKNKMKRKPLPRIDDILEKLATTKYFTKLYLFGFR